MLDVFAVDNPLKYPFSRQAVEQRVGRRRLLSEHKHGNNYQHNRGQYFYHLHTPMIKSIFNIKYTRCWNNYLHGFVPVDRLMRPH